MTRNAMPWRLLITWRSGETQESFHPTAEQAQKNAELTVADYGWAEIQEVAVAYITRRQS
jgi:hypothetical protein